jgi:hypothetical protein
MICCGGSRDLAILSTFGPNNRGCLICFSFPIILYDLDVFVANVFFFFFFSSLQDGTDEGRTDGIVYMTCRTVV